jgi:hypothetical protein
MPKNLKIPRFLVLNLNKRLYYNSALWLPPFGIPQKTGSSGQKPPGRTNNLPADEYIPNLIIITFEPLAKCLRTERTDSFIGR